MRRLIGWLLVVLGVLASALTGMMAADAATNSDYLPPAVGSAIFAVITLSCVGGARPLLADALRASQQPWSGIPARVRDGSRSRDRAALAPILVWLIVGTLYGGARIPKSSAPLHAVAPTRNDTFRGTVPNPPRGRG